MHLLFFATAAKLLAEVHSFGVAPEPWPPLSGLGFINPPAPFSPDPLVRYAFPASVNDSVLQIYELPAIGLTASPVGSFLNISNSIGSLLTNITVVRNGTLLIDFGVESAGWLEFDSPNLQPGDLGDIIMGSSEFTSVDFVAGYKQAKPSVYGSNCGVSLCTYRLETNSELYEGLRYGFLMVSNIPSRPWHITGLRAVVQAKPVNYTGSFRSAGDPLLEQIWYTGAYTVRATLQSDYMGSILEDRGDRESWTGDAHPTQATSMTAFGNFAFVLSNLNRTRNECQGIATYCLYFVLSTLDYWRETGDEATLAYLTPNIVAKLESAYNNYANPRGLRFVGHDDRLGSGFANNTTPETQSVFRFIALRCWKEFSDAMSATGNATLAAHFLGYYNTAVSALREGGVQPWWGPLWMHASGEAINAGFTNATEQAAIAEASFSSIVNIPSQSNFNQYFLLQALSTMGMLDRAVESARVAWGFQIALGATTFWEQSNPDWERFLPPGPSPLPNHEGWVSLCHPWSSGVTPWLTKWILGIRPLTPGYANTLLAPHLSANTTELSGSIATPIGKIELSVHPKSGGPGATGSPTVRVSLPPGCTGLLQLSQVLLRRLGIFSSNVSIFWEHENSSANVTGEHVTPLVSTFVASPKDTPLTDERTQLNRSGGASSAQRSWAIQVTLRGGLNWKLNLIDGGDARGVKREQQEMDLAEHTSANPFPPPTWPSTLLSSDFTTKGNWKGVYGSAGYTLFGLHNSTPQGTVQSLPSWVSSVTVQGPGNSGFQGHVFSWTPTNGSSLSNDPRALFDPGSQASPFWRGLGAAAPSGSGSWPTDIYLTEPGKSYKLAAYFCDFGPTPWGDGQKSVEGRWQSVYLLQAFPSLNPSSQRIGIKDFQGCVWLQWAVKGGVRIRVSTIRGDYAVLSAIAFDETS